MTNGLMRSMVFNRGFGEQSYGGCPRSRFTACAAMMRSAVKPGKTDWVVDEEMLKIASTRW